jgi:hypothetical protein
MNILIPVIVFCYLSGSLLAGQQMNFIVDQFAHIHGDTIAEYYVVDLVNTERGKAGLPAVQYDRQLSSAARQHSLEMYQLNYFSHTSPVKGLENPGDRVYHTGLTDFAVGENIALHSIRGSSRELAEKFMEQWMNSEGHRANILKPDFNRIGVGVLSFKDSVLRDTVIRGDLVHQIIYSIRNYGAQVFSDRDLDFYDLSVEKRSMPFVDIELNFYLDRPILARIVNMTGIFDPDQYHTSVRYSGIYENPLNVLLAYLDNFQKPVYINFFQGTLDKSQVAGFEQDLKRSKIKLIRKKITFIQEERLLLKIKSKAILRNPYRYGIVYFDQKKYYEFEPRRDTIEVLLPLDPQKKDFIIQFGLGEDQDIQLKHRIHLDAGILASLNRKKHIKTANALFKKQNW